MGPQEYRPGGKVIGAAVVAVAASYVYFLIFAQFGFLKGLLAATGLLAETWSDADAIKPVMAVMGLAGMAGSGAAAWLFSAERGRRILLIGFGLCAVAAGLSLVATRLVVFYPAALLVGLGTGLTTVTLACMLRRAVGDRHLGLIIGLGTGLAYGFSSLPAVFQAAANTQAMFALVATAVGLVAGAMLVGNATPEKPGEPDYSKAGASMWVLIFLALVWLDSTAFYIIQHTARQMEAWRSPGQLTLNAGTHLVVAVLAGWALDQRWVGRTVFVGAAALLLACLMIKTGGQVRSWNALLYSAGVSVYSVALVFYPVHSLRPGLAALVYAVAGWGGSALGIGLAENRHELPGWVIIVGTAIIMGGLAARQFLRRHGASA